jgi:DNA-binding transcriptional LysR family regulator
MPIWRFARPSMGWESRIRSKLFDPFLRSGQLVRVLEAWSPSFDGLFLYYPNRRQVPVALRALIDLLRSARGSAPAEGLLEIPVAAE